MGPPDPTVTAATWVADVWTGVHLDEKAVIPRRAEEWSWIRRYLVADRADAMARLYAAIMGPPALPPAVLHACGLFPRYPLRWDYTGETHIVPPAGPATLARAPGILTLYEAACYGHLMPLGPRSTTSGSYT